jgi:hypothetical protein
LNPSNLTLELRLGRIGSEVGHVPTRLRRVGRRQEVYTVRDSRRTVRSGANRTGTRPALTGSNQ